MSWLKDIKGIREIFKDGVVRNIRASVDFLGSAWSVEDNPTTGRTEISFNAVGMGAFSAPTNPTDNGKVCYASDGNLAYSPDVKLIDGALVFDHVSAPVSVTHDEGLYFTDPTGLDVLFGGSNSSTIYNRVAPGSFGCAFGLVADNWTDLGFFSYNVANSRVDLHASVNSLNGGRISGNWHATRDGLLEIPLTPQHFFSGTVANGGTGALNIAIADDTVVAISARVLADKGAAGMYYGELRVIARKVGSSLEILNNGAADLVEWQRDASGDVVITHAFEAAALSGQVRLALTNSSGSSTPVRIRAVSVSEARPT
jgi:hypothetical protein